MVKRRFWERKFEALDLFYTHSQAHGKEAMLTSREVSASLQIDIRQVRALLNRLIRQGLLEKVKLGCLNAYAYRLTKEGVVQRHYLYRLLATEPWRRQPQ